MRFSRVSAMTLAILFLMNYHFMPALYPLTIEEEGARKKNESKKIFRGDDRGSEDVEVSGRTAESRYSSRKGERKDPRLACLLSLIIPGGGQIYLRKDLKGIAFCLAAGAGYSVTGYYIYRSFVQNKGPDFQSKVIVSGLLFFITAIIHVVGIVEAYSDAEEINKKSSMGSGNLGNPYVAGITVE